MVPIVLFRGSLAEEAEKKAAAKYFPVVERRSAIPPGRLVIPRYSALPYYKELEDDVAALGSKLINTYKQHLFVADTQNWYMVLGEEYTPKTWFSLDQIPERGPFILKGATNSKKNLWQTHCYAANKQEAINVYLRLQEDSLIGEQAIYIRDYIPLHKLCDPISSQGAPISEEYRFFVLDGKILASGFYWSGYRDVLACDVNPDFVPRGFLNEVIERVSPFIRFFVVDVAHTAEGGWVVIELNDGQQSGLSDVSPDVLYKNLKENLL